jgi:heme/copper-type cytochrome/quinol oxidase subunit 2
VALRALVGAALACGLGASTSAGAAAPAGASLEVKVSHRGFEPSRIVVRRGETAHIVIVGSDGEHCFAIDALRIEKRVVAGRPTHLELLPERPGSFPFYCCVESGKQAEIEKGELVVTE